MFGLFSKKAATKPQTPEEVAPALGWKAIEKAFGELYPGGTPIWWEHRGVHRVHDLQHPPENPLEAVAIHDAGSFWHYVSFGLSDLFAKESQGGWSGFGYELTFRLAKDASDGAPLWPVNVLVGIAKAAHLGQQFAPGHTIKSGPIDGRPENALTALLVTKDPGIQLIDSPHGKVAFLLLVGVEGSMREQARASGVDEVLAQLSARDRDLVTRV